jgi:hypothetical protein
MSIMLKERPIFIIGHERSGTTLLMALLGCHPRIGIPEVGWLFPRIYPWRHTYGDLSIDANFRTLVDEMLFGLNQPLWGMAMNPMTAVDEIISLAEERSFAGVYAAMHQRYLQQEGKPRWGQKTPNNLYFVPQILDCFPNAQFLHITRDGRDVATQSMRSAFGAGNIFGAADTWHKANLFVNPFREQYPATVWMDVKYEELCRAPEQVLRAVCQFIEEEYDPNMLNFHQTPIAAQRGKQRDHAPLGQPVSEKHIGIYKYYLSVYEQQVYAAIAGQTHLSAGYALDHEAVDIDPAERDLMLEWEGRFRAARLDGPGGHILFESYRDWLVDQRERRKARGIWNDADDPGEFPAGHPDEEIIVGFRSSRKWRDHFNINRRYTK